MVSRLLVVFGLGLAAPAYATPSQAASLGGLDLYYPGDLDTFMYFDTDLNLFANPALAHRYRNQVQANLGFSGGGLAQGIGINPRALGLFGVGDSLTLGFGLNRSTGEYGEKAALGNALDSLMLGSTTAGELGGGTYQDPLTLAGLGAAAAAPALQPPLDLYGAYAFGDAVIGLNIYAAFGESGAVTETELVPGGVDTDWTRALAVSRSTYVGATAGFALEGDPVKAEGWVRYTSISSWADAQAYGPGERGKWQEDEDLLIDRTVGLQGVNRVGLGGRAAIAASDKVDVTPALLVDIASGHTFAVDRLAENVEDPDESAVAQAEDDEVTARALSLRGGIGVEFRPTDPLKIITTVGVDVQKVAFLVDNVAQKAGVLGSTHFASEDRATTLRLPVVSLGGEYAFSEVFTLRGAARATVLLNRVNVNTLDQSGIEADNWVLADSGETRVGFDGGDVPAVTAAVGPAIHLGDASLEGVVGGALVGTGDDFFSRIDAVFKW